MPRIIPAFTQFFDDNGDPLVDGYLKFLETGTNNTDKTTYADINETIANSNPVVLGGDGRCPNVFGSGAYRVISYTANGTQIQQFDPVSGESLTGAFASWTASAIYSIGDIVTGSDGEYYRSIVNNNQAANPTSSPASWETIDILGIWNTSIEYDLDDLAIYNGLIWRSLANSNSGNDPETSPSFWFPENSRTSNVTITPAADSDVTLTAIQNSASVRILETGSWISGHSLICDDADREFTVTNNSGFTATVTTSGTTPTTVDVPGDGKPYDLQVRAGVGAEYIAALDVDINGQTAEASIAADDEIIVYDTSASANRKATLANAITSAAGASLVLLGSASASNDATVEFTSDIDSTYDEYEIHLVNVVPATDAVYLRGRVSEDGGSTWKDGASDYTYGYGYFPESGTIAGNGSAGTTYIQYTEPQGSAAGESFSGKIVIYNPSETTLYKKIQYDIAGQNQAGSSQRFSGSGQYVGTTNAINGVQLFFSSGNIESGNFYLYGVKKS